MTFWEVLKAAMPHGHCIFYDTRIISMYAIGDLLTLLSYMGIPFYLFLVYRNRKDLPLSFRKMVIWFAVFIFFCGTGHAIRFATFWVPAYLLESIWLVCTGLVSLQTWILFWKNREFITKRSKRLEEAEEEIDWLKQQLDKYKK